MPRTIACSFCDDVKVPVAARRKQVTCSTQRGRNFALQVEGHVFSGMKTNLAREKDRGNPLSVRLKKSPAFLRNVCGRCLFQARKGETITEHDNNVVLPWIIDDDPAALPKILASRRKTCRLRTRAGILRCKTTTSAAGDVPTTFAAGPRSLRSAAEIETWNDAILGELARGGVLRPVNEHAPPSVAEFLARLERIPVPACVLDPDCEPRRRDQWLRTCFHVTDAQLANPEYFVSVAEPLLLFAVTDEAYTELVGGPRSPGGGSTRPN